MTEQNSTLFLGHYTWKNITVGKMIRFFGIMLQIMLEPRKMGGSKSYFADLKSIHLGYGYELELRGYHAWAKEVSSIQKD